MRTNFSALTFNKIRYIKSDVARLAINNYAHDLESRLIGLQHPITGLGWVGLDWLLWTMWLFSLLYLVDLKVTNLYRHRSVTSMPLNISEEALQVLI